MEKVNHAIKMEKSDKDSFFELMLFHFRFENCNKTLMTSVVPLECSGVPASNGPCYAYKGGLQL